MRPAGWAFRRCSIFRLSPERQTGRRSPWPMRAADCSKAAFPPKNRSTSKVTAASASDAGNPLFWLSASRRRARPRLRRKNCPRRPPTPAPRSPSRPRQKNLFPRPRARWSSARTVRVREPLPSPTCPLRGWNWKSQPNRRMPPMSPGAQTSRRVQAPGFR